MFSWSVCGFLQTLESLKDGKCIVSEYPMGETVYLLGAGTNQTIKSWAGQSPPLIDNFFRVALSIDKYRSEKYLKQLKRVYDYIERYWKMSVDDLASGRFDLEECFTLVGLQLIDAISKGNLEDVDELRWVQYLLKSFLAEVLTEFEHDVHRSGEMRLLGNILWAERATVLTFNYDTIIEEVIKSASGVNPKAYPKCVRDFMKGSMNDDDKEIPDEVLAASHCRWADPLGYGIRFDEVTLPIAGVPIRVDGKRYYSIPSNELYDWPVLKLHGSINWFRYTQVRDRPTMPGEEPPKFKKEMKDKMILDRGKWWFTTPPSRNGWYLDSVIITPDLHKEKNLNHPVFNEIWEKARHALSKCSRLIVIGYSFPPTDFMTKKLFLESFSDHHLEELIIVNPDTSVVRTVKELCHYSRPVIICRDVTEFVRSHSLFSRLGYDVPSRVASDNTSSVSSESPTDSHDG